MINYIDSKYQILEDRIEKLKQIPKITVINK